MGINVNDLPLAVRKRLAEQIDDARVKGTKPKKSRAGTSQNEECPGHCAACGEKFPKYGTDTNPAGFPQHARTTGHLRWVIDT